MLVLSRKKSEQIKIGDGVVVTVVSIRRGAVRLGIDAPDDMPVHRAEIDAQLAAQGRRFIHDKPAAEGSGV